MNQSLYAEDRRRLKRGLRNGLLLAAVWWGWTIALVLLWLER